MSPTHDYILSNQSGASFRTDLNNALAAIVSNNSNSSSPATTYAYQWWADTSAGVLKIRNSANNAWIELLQLDGTLTIEDGNATTPGLAFRDDLNTGIFQNTNDTLNIGTGGQERLEFNSTEVIFNDPGNDVDFRIEGDTEANLFFVNAGTNRVGVGTNSPSATFDVAGDIEATIADNASYQEGLNITNGTNADFNVNIKSNATSIGPSTNTPFSFHVHGHANEKLRIDANGKLSTGGESAPDVSAGGLCLNQGSESANVFTCKSSDINHGRTSVDETDTWFSLRKVSDNKGGAFIHGYTDQSGGDPGVHIAGYIDSQGTTFRAIQLTGARKNPNNAGSTAFQSGYPIVRISNDFDTTVASFTPDGLAFGSDNAAANSLGDYEEGTFTPGSNATLSSAAGSYTKIGRQVTLHMRIVVASQSGSAAFEVNNFPFTADMPSAVSNGGMAGGFGYISSGSTIPQIHNIHNGTSTQFYNFNNFMSISNVSGKEYRFGLVYHT